MPEATGQDTPTAARSAPDQPETPQSSNGSAKESLAPNVLWRMLRQHWQLVAMLTALAVVIVLPMASAAPGFKPTPTRVPTETLAPTPTALPGFLIYTDQTTGFAIEYPQGSVCHSANPGSECVDNETTPTFTLQVQRPSSWAVTHPNDPAAWLDHALTAFSEEPHATFARAPGPATITSIAGHSWLTNGGVVTLTQPPAPTATVPAQAGVTPTAAPSPQATPAPQIVQIRVQIYVTLLHGKAYVLAMTAPVDRFTEGLDSFFLPMLKTFRFLAS